MKVKFSRCTSSNLANVPKVDGQLVYTKDTGEVYLDTGNVRNKISDVVEVADIQNVQSPLVSKIYYDEATEKLYKAEIENNTVSWINLSGEEQVPQIFFWSGGNTAQDLALWDSIVEANRTQIVAVVWNDANYGNIIYITQNINELNPNTIYANAFAYSPTIVKEASITTYKIPLVQLQIIKSNGHVSTVRASTGVRIVPFLSTLGNYETPFIPTQAGQPASKQYVDNVVGNINTLLDTINGEVV